MIQIKRKDLQKLLATEKAQAPEWFDRFLDEAWFMGQQRLIELLNELDNGEDS